MYLNTKEGSMRFTILGQEFSKDFEKTEELNKMPIYVTVELL